MAETALAKGGEQVKTLIESAAPKIRTVLARHMDSERFVRMAIFNITRSPQLARCTPLSLLECVMEAATLGLNIGGVAGECYAVPYGDKATFILGYKGMVSLARRSGEIATIQAEVVRHGDEFDFEYGMEDKFRHKPKADPDSEVTHVWARAKFKDGAYQFCVMSKSEIDAIRKRSRAGQAGPWVTDYAEMAKKTAVRRLAKMLPLTPEAQEAFEKDVGAEFGDAVKEVVSVTVSEDAPKAPRSKRIASKLAEPEPTPERPQTLDDEMPPITEDDGTPAEQEPSGEITPHEQIVIEMAEAQDVPHADAKAAIEKWCQMTFRKGFKDVTVLAPIKKAIREGYIKAR